MDETTDAAVVLCSLHVWSVADSRSIRGVKLIFTRGQISLEVAFKGLNIILGLYKCNYSVTVK